MEQEEHDGDSRERTPSTATGGGGGAGSEAAQPARVPRPVGRRGGGFGRLGSRRGRARRAGAPGGRGTPRAGAGGGLPGGGRPRYRPRHRPPPGVLQLPDELRHLLEEPADRPAPQQRRRGALPEPHRQLLEGAAAQRLRRGRAGGLREPAQGGREWQAGRLRRHRDRRPDEADQPAGRPGVRPPGSRRLGPCRAAAAGDLLGRDGERRGRELLDGRAARRQLHRLPHPSGRGRRLRRPEPLRRRLQGAEDQRQGDPQDPVPRHPAGLPERPLHVAVHVPEHPVRRRVRRAEAQDRPSGHRSPDRLRQLAGDPERQPGRVVRRPARPPAPLCPQRPRHLHVGAHGRPLPGLLQRLPDPDRPAQRRHHGERSRLHAQSRQPVPQQRQPVGLRHLRSAGHQGIDVRGGRPGPSRRPGTRSGRSTGACAPRSGAAWCTTRRSTTGIPA